MLGNETLESETAGTGRTLPVVGETWVLKAHSLVFLL